MLHLNDKFVNDTNTVQSPVHSWHELVTVTSNQDKFCVHRGSDSLQGSATAVCFKFSLANYLEEKQGWKWNSALRFTDKTKLVFVGWDKIPPDHITTNPKIFLIFPLGVSISCHTTVISIKLPCAHSSVDSTRLLPVLAGQSTAKSWKTAFPTTNHPTLNARKIRKGRKKKEITATFSAKHSKILNSRAR